MEALLLILAIIVLYFLPALVAEHRGHHNKTAIIVLNVLAGWTIAGWIIAIVWASTATAKAKA
jgi:hypothetical protein